MPVKKTVSFSVPKLAINNKLYIPLLVVLVVAAAYLLGVLTTKVQYLEGGKVSTTVTDSDLAPTDDSGGVATTPVDVEAGHLPLLGDKNAPVTVIEFSDFQCPFCKSLWE